MFNNTSSQVFIMLTRAGLWEKDVRLSPSIVVDYKEVFKQAEDQSVIGLVAAGLEHVVESRVPQEDALSFAGYALQAERQNTKMNCFIGALVDKMNAAKVNAILIKGQGIAQCYERPLWRANGDVDLLLDKDNYHRAKEFLSSFSSLIEEEDIDSLHYAVAIDSWIVELHGTFRSGLGKRIDSVIDVVQQEVFEKNQIRIWQNRETKVQLPSPDNDVFFVFTHILQHFFRGGIGLRQICDWCRLLWTYHGSIDIQLLEYRLRSARLMSEWKAFAAMVVDILGMPIEAMPLFDDSKKWEKKAKQIFSLILETGNFGHNRDMSYQQQDSFVMRKTISFGYILRDSLKRLMIFPMDSSRVLGRTLWLGFQNVIRRR